MKMRWNKAVFAMAVIMSLMLFVPMEASAGEVTSGTIGDNGGLQWTYDSETKTLVLTGEDSLSVGYYEGEPEENPIDKICSDVEKIVLRDCTLKGSCKGAFRDLDCLKYVECEDVDTSQVTDMQSMFIGCSSLTSLDLSGFDTSQVTNMGYMFTRCSSLTSLELGSFDTSQVTDMECMFSKCSSLTSLDLSGFDTSQVIDMECMFMECSNLTSLELSNFDTS